MKNSWYIILLGVLSVVTPGRVHALQRYCNPPPEEVFRSPGFAIGATDAGPEFQEVVTTEVAYDFSCFDLTGQEVELRLTAGQYWPTINISYDGQTYAAADAAYNTSHGNAGTFNLVDIYDISVDLEGVKYVPITSFSQPVSYLLGTVDTGGRAIVRVRKRTLRRGALAVNLPGNSGPALSGSGQIAGKMVVAAPDMGAGASSRLLHIRGAVRSYVAAATCVFPNDVPVYLGSFTVKDFSTTTPKSFSRLVPPTSCESDAAPIRYRFTFADAVNPAGDVTRGLTLTEGEGYATGIQMKLDRSYVVNRLSNGVLEGGGFLVEGTIGRISDDLPVGPGTIQAQVTVHVTYD